MNNILDCLKMAVDNGASDIFIVAGGPACLKIDGIIKPIDDQRLMPADTKDMILELYKRANRSSRMYIENGDDDFSLPVSGLARFRINAYRQRGSFAAVIRIVSFDIPDYQRLGIPEEVMNLSKITNGMLIVTGIAGSGKSTTQACIIDRINKTRNCHIVTLEDPIEFLHRNNKSIVSQREISIDTADYLSALKSCLRQAPDVILLGEMRDYEAIHTAITAAETGHLVIATLHTNGAVNAIDRIIDSFPASRQEQIREQLSEVLHTVVSQKLLPEKGGGLLPAFEIMHMNSAIKSLIRDNRNYQINNHIASGAEEGMMTMDQFILSLYKQNRITAETALHYADEPKQMVRRIETFGNSDDSAEKK